MLGVGTNCDDVGLRLVTYAKELVCRWVRGDGVATVPCPSTMWIPHPQWIYVKKYTGNASSESLDHLAS